MGLGGQETSTLETVDQGMLRGWSWKQGCARTVGFGLTGMGEGRDSSPRALGPSLPSSHQLSFPVGRAGTEKFHFYLWLCLERGPQDWVVEKPWVSSTLVLDVGATQSGTRVTQPLCPQTQSQGPQVLRSVLGTTSPDPSHARSHLGPRPTAHACMSPTEQPRAPSSPEEEGAGALAQHVVRNHVAKLPGHIAHKL